MENIKVNDIKKTGGEVKPPVTKEKEATEEVLSPKDEFLLECDEEESKIFLQLVDILTDQCEKEEYEAVKGTDENFEDFSMMITHIKHGKMMLEDDGVVVNLRKPLVSDGNVLADKIKVLYERNKDRELQYNKGIKIKKGDMSSTLDQTTATLAASCLNGDGKPVSVKTMRLLYKKGRDYSHILNAFNFFLG